MVAAHLDPPPAELFQYLPEYRVAVCTSCHYAVQPQAFARHLTETHHITRGRRRPFLQYVSELDLDEPKNVLDLQIRKFPVPLLPVLDGFACRGGSCSHLCASVQRMKSHWLSEHGRLGQASLDWHPAPLQTFFRGTLISYFTNPEIKLSTTHKAHCERKKVTMHEVNQDLTQVDEVPPSMDAECSSILHGSESHLLAHYIQSTSISISQDAETRLLWKERVPQLAQEHTFLMHGILACSALHQAHLSPTHQPSYIIAATTYQNLAIPAFRAAMTHPTLDNSEALLIFSHLLVIYSFASEKQDESLLLAQQSDDVLPPWLYFLRNGCALLCDVWDHLESSPCRGLAEMWDIPLIVPVSPSPLVIQLLSFIPAPTSASTWDADTIEIYKDAAHALGTAFLSTETTRSFTAWDAIRVWPMYLETRYMELLRERHPGALVLLAHYCVLLGRLQGWWFFEGRAERLMRTVVREIGEEWRWCIRWPLEELGLSAEELV